MLKRVNGSETKSIRATQLHVGGLNQLLHFNSLNDFKHVIIIDSFVFV